MIPFHPHRQPDWPRARRLVAQLEYERDARGVENYAGAWSPAQHCRKEAA